MGVRGSRLVGFLLCAAACGEGSSQTGESSGATGSDAADGSDSTGALPELRCGPDPAGPSGWIDSISTVGTDLGGDDSVVYTGETLIAFGGRDDAAVGGIYTFATRTWQPIDTDGAPTNIRDATLVWTGDRLLVWGGVTASGLIDVVAVGGVYDPASDSWQAMSSAGAPEARRRAFGAWTGTDAIFWGGSTWSDDDVPDSQYLESGGRYDPATDTWTPMSEAPVEAETLRGVTWTGTSLIAAGTSGAARYDPATDTWTDLCGALGLDAASHVWYGDGLISFGGYESIATRNQPVNRGARSVEADPCGWFETSMVGAPSGRKRHTAVWTGSTMLVFGGDAADGGSYDPTTDSWEPLAEGTPGSRADHRAIWTGSEMIVWGGLSVNEAPTGCIYRP